MRRQPQRGAVTFLFGFGRVSQFVTKKNWEMDGWIEQPQWLITPHPALTRIYVLIDCHQLLYRLALANLSLAMTNWALYAASLCAAASLVLVWKWRQNRRRSLYPPGPKGYPLIGNIWDIPQDIPVWQAYIPLAQKFGGCPFDLSWRSLKRVLRYGRAISEVTCDGFRCFEQRRGHHRLDRETV